jgi:deoxyadenosine/deoxycytidine kinase
MLIVVEGCVGVGKSTVAKGLAAVRHSEAFLERFDENPFLNVFYQDPVENALETEFAFLLLHYHQLKALNHKSGAVESIADFCFDKDLLYAKLNLTDSEFVEMFRNLHGALAARIPEPDLMICLTATNDLVLSRIRTRNRPAEQQIDPSYYTRLNSAYSKFFSEYRRPKLFVNMNEVDFLKEPSSFRRLSDRIDLSFTSGKLK